MIKINFIEPLDNKLWSDWRQSCEAETMRFIEAINNGDSGYKVSNLYKNKKIKKAYYFNDNFSSPFWRKCAYCEESVASQDGDIEHFRPKNRASDNNFNPINGHNGYYWLAYNWRNLLPSCLQCNQLRIWEKEEGKVYIGKLDRFPLEDEEKRVYSHIPGDLSNEGPLLINPLIEDPEDHLEVNTDTGVMEWKTMRGKTCVDIFGLNIRDDLRNGRSAVIEQVCSLCHNLITYSKAKDKIHIHSTIIELLKFASGEHRFSLAARSCLKSVIGTDYHERLLNKMAE